MPNKKRILVVDDEASLARMIKFNLEATDEYEVRAESQGSQAMSAARDFKPNLILLDLVMLDMDGAEVASQFKEDPELKKIPIVFFTGTIAPGELTAEEGSIGGHTFLSKPVCLDDLLKCVQKHA